MSFTLVSVHAHPDDECLLTGGTLALAAAQGHRVVLVVATNGAEGLACAAYSGGRLAATRADELRRSADALGVALVHELGYDDSGMDGLAGRDGEAFARVDVEVAARRLADVLLAEGADAVTVYDPAGGYGHPDHVQVHRVGVLAAQIAGTPLVLEATVDRTSLLRVLRFLRLLRMLRIAPPDWRPGAYDRAFSERARITHRLDVRRYAPQKRAAMAAHASQATADAGDRTLALFLRLPRFVFRWAFGHEWFVERGRAPGGPVLDDLFASLRRAGGAGEHY